MKDLLSYMLKGITGEDVEISEDNDGNGFITYNISVPQDKIGIVIGKGGKTINSLKNILKIRAIRENVHVDIRVNEA